MEQENVLGKYLPEDLYEKGYKICAVGQNTVNYRCELIYHSLHCHQTEVGLINYLEDNYGDIEGYAIEYVQTGKDYAHLYHRHNKNDDWELIEYFNIVWKPIEYYLSGNLTKPAIK